MKTTTSWYAAALNSLGDGVIAADTEGKVTFLNPAASRLTGWAQAEAMGQDIAAVYHVVNAKTGEAVSLTDIPAGSERVALPVNRVLVARDGTRFYIQDNASPVQETHQSITGVIVVFRDATAEYEAQQAVEQGNIQSKYDRYETFYRLKSLLQVSTVLLDLSVEEDGNLSMFVVMALSYFIHALAEAEDALSLPTEVGSARAVLVNKTLSHLLTFIQRTIPHRPIVLHCEPLLLSTRQSTPLAYLVTAAIGNAFRHGNGKIEVRLKVVGDEVQLDVSDDGANLPDTSQPHPQRYILWCESETEAELIDSVVHRDLGGRIVETPEKDRGRMCVTFPLEQ